MKYDEKFIITCRKLGSRIKIKRIQKNISIKEMSKMTGISVEYLKRIEAGNAYGVMMEKHLLKIAKALQVKLSYLFDFE